VSPVRKNKNYGCKIENNYSERKQLRANLCCYIKYGKSLDVISLKLIPKTNQKENKKIYFQKSIGIKSKYLVNSKGKKNRSTKITLSGHRK
jgi:hypothetical protein